MLTKGAPKHFNLLRFMDGPSIFAEYIYIFDITLNPNSGFLSITGLSAKGFFLIALMDLTHLEILKSSLLNIFLTPE